MIGFEQFDGILGENARLAWDTLQMKPRKGIPSWIVHTMDIPFLEEMTGNEPGSYSKDPHRVYLEFQKLCGTCLIDQYIPDNPLSMGERGYESDRERGATTGAREIELNGIRIDSPEAVVEHMEQFDFPHLERQIGKWGSDDATVSREASNRSPTSKGGPALSPANEDAADRLIEAECEVQQRFGPDILKVPYGGGFQCFPGLRYGQFGYVHYFMAYALFPEVMEKDFRLQADLAEMRNRIAARAFAKGKLPKFLRLDHDMTDSRGTLVDINSLDAIWFPHFARSLEPYHEAGVRLIWHCDGNVMTMVPRLVECGVRGFQGFQYEDGVDFEKICGMSDRDGGPLTIWAGVSVTKTLPFGTPDNVRDEMRWLVKNGPKTGLFLGGSSSICPGTNRENIRAMIEGIRYYREHGRGGCD